jgi:hypothetical protein
VLPGIANGEEGNTRDIIAAIRTLKQIEQEGRRRNNVRQHVNLAVPLQLHDAFHDGYCTMRLQ